MTYLSQVQARTPTRFWVNNPTGEELALAVAADAFAGTTNPAYGARLLKTEPAYMQGVIGQACRDGGTDEAIADRAYQTISARFMAAFLPAYQAAGGRRGWVTMQDDPRNDDAADKIVAAALRHQAVGENYMAKIPVIRTGMDAMAALIERNIPMCATESFAISQALAMCELYERVSKKCRKYPPFFITHITGIYDEELQAQVQAKKIDIAPEILREAGSIIGRKQYRLLKARGYHTTMLGGGVRAPLHFTGFVGGDCHVTMNWNTCDELNRGNRRVESQIDVEAPAEYVQELCAKLPDFKRAYEEDGLKPEEFEHFSALLRFRGMFVAGCDAVLAAVRQIRR